VTIHVRRSVDGIEITYSRSCEYAWQLDNLVFLESLEPGQVLELVVEEH
jgi:hypothetical protein